MRKKIAAIVLALCLVFSLAACSSGGSGTQSSQPQASSSAAGSEAPQESSSEEEPAEEAVSESVLSSYGLTAEEFAALKTSIQEHIDSEWDAEEAYLTTDNGGTYDCAFICSIIRDEVEDRAEADASEDIRNDEAMETFINSEIEKTYSTDSLTPLWKERNIVLAHAVNDWVAKQNISYDLYYHTWDTLAAAFTAMSMAEDDTYLAPLFDLGGE